MRMDFKTFAQEHVSQITATAGLVTYAITRKKLTAGGIVAGCFVALVHMIHPWPTVFWLLILFFLLGTVVTKVWHVFDIMHERVFSRFSFPSTATTY